MLLSPSTRLGCSIIVSSFSGCKIALLWEPSDDSIFSSTEERCSLHECASSWPSGIHATSNRHLQWPSIQNSEFSISVLLCVVCLFSFLQFQFLVASPILIEQQTQPCKLKHMLRSGIASCVTLEDHGCILLAQSSPVRKAC